MPTTPIHPVLALQAALNRLTRRRRNRAHARRYWAGARGGQPGTIRLVLVLAVALVLPFLLAAAMDLS